MEKSRITRKIFPVAIWSFMLLWCVIFFIILFWGIMTALKTPINFFMDPLGLPKAEYGGFNFENFAAAFQHIKVIVKSQPVFIPEMLGNTVIYCFLFGTAHVVCPMICSYVYAKYSQRIRWVKCIWWIVLINMFVPLSASLAASLNLAIELGIYNSFLGMWLTALCGFSGTFMVYYAIWKSVSWTYSEAAFIDGASHFRVFLQIMFPMTLNVFWVLFLTATMTYYNDYQTPMIYLPSHPTLAYGVFRFQTSVDNGATDVTVKLAGLIMVALPMFVLFMIFREKMMTSLTIGGLKG